MDSQVNKHSLFTGAPQNCFTILRGDTELIKIFNKIIDETYPKNNHKKYY